MAILQFLPKGTKGQLSLPWKQFQHAGSVRVCSWGFSVSQAAEPKAQGNWNNLTWAASIPPDKEGNQTTQHILFINILQPPTSPSMIQSFSRKIQVICACCWRKCNSISLGKGKNLPFRYQMDVWKQTPHGNELSKRFQELTLRKSFPSHRHKGSQRGALIQQNVSQWTVM